MEETNKDDLNLDKSEDVGNDDLKIENDALKQLLTENKETEWLYSDDRPDGILYSQSVC